MATCPRCRPPSSSFMAKRIRWRTQQHHRSSMRRQLQRTRPWSLLAKIMKGAKKCHVVSNGDRLTWRILNPHFFVCCLLNYCLSSVHFLSDGFDWYHSVWSSCKVANYNNHSLFAFPYFLRAEHLRSLPCAKRNAWTCLNKNTQTSARSNIKIPLPLNSKDLPKGGLSAKTMLVAKAYQRHQKTSTCILSIRL